MEKMPEYMKPNNTLMRTLEAAILLDYVFTELGMPVPEAAIKVKNAMYGDVLYHDTFIFTLFETCNSMTYEQKESIIYDAHRSMSRRLLIWWEIQLIFDKQRSVYM